jgi:hydrogenase maturation protein HypF
MEIQKMTDTTIRIRVFGIVQGVGFRPTVSRHAAECGVRGWVCNKGPYVEILAQGDDIALARFKENIEHRPPERAVILNVDVSPVNETTEYADFSITESERETGDILIPPDIAICEACKKELFDKNDRRYLHPFINCTCCGPRLTILDALPYDRERTSMKDFPMCPECAAEYTNPESRRYDAQPVCCNECGPEVYLLGRRERGRSAIIEARRILSSGGILAVKGIGGFHLCCDAKNASAVERMRAQKNRPMKPFAVMMRDIDTVKRECELTEAQEAVLTGHQKPIVLLKKKPGTSLCEAVAPQNPKAGVMLPYAPIQLLLFDYDDGLNVSDALVMTSGNTSGAPICREEADARAELLTLCDAILSHDRTIRMRADDTVMDFYEDKEYMIRRSRGYAPLPYLVENAAPYAVDDEPLDEVERENTEVLAMGGELKNSFCIGKNRLFYMSPYIGDMEDLRTQAAQKESIARFCDMLEVKPQAVACDLHPRYYTSVAAEEYGIPIVRVQHHYAHIVSCMAENNYMEKVIGVSFDGTGYGTDGTVWGGEILLADGCGFTRSGHIAPFLQIGGDLSAKEGWRIACSMIYGLTKNETEAKHAVQRLGLCSETEANVLFRMYDRKVNAIVSTSAGRLFDAVSAILGIRRSSTFEGEASTALQFAAETYAAEHFPGEADITGQLSKKTDNSEISEPFGEGDLFVEGDQSDQPLILATDALVAAILKHRLAGEDAGKLAYDFHRKLARLIVFACTEIRTQTNCNVAALSGGCFQNLLLLDLCKKGLEGSGFRVLTHHLVPPNDGGIALGQAVVASNIFAQPASTS